MHTCHHFHLHILLEPSLIQPLSKAAFHKELDDSCVCGENQGFTFLSSEVSEHGDACHHLTRWGCKVSRVQAGDFFPYREGNTSRFYNSCSCSRQMASGTWCWLHIIKAESHPKKQLKQTRSWILITSLNAFHITKLLFFCIMLLYY